VLGEVKCTKDRHSKNLTCMSWNITQMQQPTTKMTRSTQPRVHMYMSCPYVISTLYRLLEESQLWTSKRYFSRALFSQLYTLEIWIRIPLLFITTVVS
jgi:hypothetical protein